MTGHKLSHLAFVYEWGWEWESKSIAAVANTPQKLECSEGQIPLEKCYTTRGGWEGTEEGFHSLALLTSEAPQIPQGYLSVARWFPGLTILRLNHEGKGKHDRKGNEERWEACGKENEIVYLHPGGPQFKQLLQEKARLVFTVFVSRWFTGLVASSAGGEGNEWSERQEGGEEKLRKGIMKGWCSSGPRWFTGFAVIRPRNVLKFPLSVLPASGWAMKRRKGNERREGESKRRMGESKG